MAGEATAVGEGVLPSPLGFSAAYSLASRRRTNLETPSSPIRKAET